MLIPGKVLHNETQRHVRGLSNRDDELIGHLDLLIRGLHDEGLWDKISILCVAHLNSADSLLDLKGNQDSILVGSPSFIADQGFTVSAGPNVISTQFPFDPSHSFSSSLSVYVRGLTLGYLMGQISPSPSNFDFVTNYNSSTAMSGALQGTSVRDHATDPVGGMRMLSRENVEDFNMLANGNTVQYKQTATIQNPILFDLAVGTILEETGYSNIVAAGQYASWHAGYGMTISEMLAYETLIQAFFTRRGTAV